MSDTWLVLDCNNLCYRAFYTTGHLATENGSPTGVMFGFFRDIAKLAEWFMTNKFAFCFDHPINNRKKIYSAYQAGRVARVKMMTPLQAKALRQLREQMDKLREEYLPTMGFKNIFWEEGFEADDLIASLASSIRDISHGNEVILVSTDKDLYQLLRPRVKIFNPAHGKIYDLNSFKEEYGIHPSQWPWVRAVSGCRSDGVPGIGKIGEASALSFLKDELSKTTQRFKILNSDDNKDAIDMHLRLVCLPLEGTPHCPLKKDKHTMSGWRKVMHELEMHSLVKRYPF